MKCLFMFILLSYVNLGVSQGYRVLLNDTLSWSDWEKPLSKGEKMTQLKLVDDKLIEDLNKSLSWRPDENPQNFHFVDFDSDGDEDIIYYGFAGSESEMTIFFQYRNGKYYRFLELFGKIVEVWKPFPVSPLFFKLIEYPCCDTYTYHIASYVPIVNGPEINYRVSSKIAYVMGTEFPSEVDQKGKLFRVQNERYVLRKDPKIDNGSDSENGNIVAEYTTGAMGYALAESADETGRVWWFVMMINNIQPGISHFQRSNNDQMNPYYMGWMSSRYLEEL